jgi:hypothetical protein
LWYTAWVNAGKPNLDKFDNKEISDSLKEANKAEEQLKMDINKEIKGHND